MSQPTRIVTTAATLMIPLFLLTGCHAFWMNVSEKDPAKAKHLDAKYDPSDHLTFSKQIIEAVLADFPPPGETPVGVELGIENATNDHLETKGLADTIVTGFIDSKKIKFVGSTQRDALLREQNYQLQNCKPETKAAIGKQLGAKYMLTGRLIEIEKKSGREVRLSKTRDVYYQLTLTLTDITTGEIVVQKQKDRLRSAKEPLIGW